MGKKKFEEVPYNPIAADLAREVGAAGRHELSRPVPEHTIIAGNVALKLEEGRALPAIRPRAEEATVTKRLTVTRSEDDEIVSFLHRLQQRAGTKVPFAVIARAALNVAMQAEEQLIAEIGDKFSMELPSTHDAIAQAEYEDRWIKLLLKAVRKMPSSSTRVGKNLNALG